MQQADLFTLFDDSNYYSGDAVVNLTNCDREPIHIPGSIQPQGVLLLVDPTLTIRQLSENVHFFFGKEASALLGQPLHSLLGEQATQEVSRRLISLSQQHHFGVRLPDTASEWELTLHRNGEALVVELEPLAEGNSIDLMRYSALVKELQLSENREALCQKAAGFIRELSGFDRVMVYRFHEDESGEVVAESLAAGMDSYLGLYFPATDIPRQARALYLHNPLRLIRDVDAIPAGLLPTENPLSGGPLNLSLSVLRSVSPIHLQYLRNMGVAASMSLAIVLEGHLWGLIACHHRQPRGVGYAQREACYLLCRSFSSMLQDLLRQEYLVQRQVLKSLQTTLLDRISQEQSYISSLYLQQPSVKDLFACGGCAICQGDEVFLLGDTPGREQVLEIANWLHKDIIQELYCTNSLAKEYGPAEAFQDTACGLLAIAVSRIQREYILWFRPELLQTVRWAGNPQKSVQQGDGDLAKLAPRTSFAAWTEQIRGTSQGWKLVEIQTAREMRAMLVDAALRVSGELSLKADILSRLNVELERSNNELDSFAYIASHDLKEPLRGIYNYSQFLLEDYADKLDAAGKDKLTTLMRLSVRMEHLLNSLLHFTRVGRMDIHKTEVNLSKTVEEVRDMLCQPGNSRPINIRLAHPLPVVQGDELQLLELYQNLIANGIKYNVQEHVDIEVGCLPAVEGEGHKGAKQIFYVKDNGIGIDQRHHEAVFTIFRRLHARQAFGGGTGVGLTLVKKIIERHRGEIWLESQLGKGTTFFFTLGE
jgi:two-component system, chemotaxis family, sensor kinase Cph1